MVCTQEEMERRVMEELRQRSLREDINRMMALSYQDCCAKDGTVMLCHRMAAWERNVMDTMHGGLITFLLDAAMAIACRACTGDRAMPTMDLYVSFLRPVWGGEAICVEGRVEHVGRRTIHASARLWTGGGERLCAAASANFCRTAPAGEASGGT